MRLVMTHVLSLSNTRIPEYSGTSVRRRLPGATIGFMVFSKKHLIFGGSLGPW